MKEKTRQDAIDIIESRIKALADSNGDHLVKHGLNVEAAMAIDMSHLFGAIDLDEQRHYKERLERIVERDHQQWLEQTRRL